MFAIMMSNELSCSVYRNVVLDAPGSFKNIPCSCAMLLSTKNVNACPSSLFVVLVENSLILVFLLDDAICTRLRNFSPGLITFPCLKRKPGLAAFEVPLEFFERPPRVRLRLLARNFVAGREADRSRLTPRCREGVRLLERDAVALPMAYDPSEVAAAPNKFLLENGCLVIRIVIELQRGEIHIWMKTS